MDLNHLYAQHQMLLMRAGSRSPADSRGDLMVAARDVACMIWSCQVELGAPAADGWCNGQHTQTLSAQQPEARA